MSVISILWDEGLSHPSFICDLSWKISFYLTKVFIWRQKAEGPVGSGVLKPATPCNYWINLNYVKKKQLWKTVQSGVNQNKRPGAQSWNTSYLCFFKSFSAFPSLAYSIGVYENRNDQESLQQRNRFHHCECDTLSWPTYTTGVCIYPQFALQ